MFHWRCSIICATDLMALETDYVANVIQWHPRYWHWSHQSEVRSWHIICSLSLTDHLFYMKNTLWLLVSRHHMQMVWIEINSAAHRRKWEKKPAKYSYHVLNLLPNRSTNLKTYKWKTIKFSDVRFLFVWVNYKNVKNIDKAIENDTFSNK